MGEQLHCHTSPACRGGGALHWPGPASELRILNPFCPMDVLTKTDTLGVEVVLSKDVLEMHRPYTAIVVSDQAATEEGVFRVE